MNNRVLGLALEQSYHLYLRPFILLLFGGWKFLLWRISQFHLSFLGKNTSGFATITRY